MASLFGPAGDTILSTAQFHTLAPSPVLLSLIWLEALGQGILHMWVLDLGLCPTLLFSLLRKEIQAPLGTVCSSLGRSCLTVSAWG